MSDCGDEARHSVENRLLGLGVIRHSLKQNAFSIVETLKSLYHFGHFHLCGYQLNVGEFRGCQFHPGLYRVA